MRLIRRSLANSTARLLGWLPDRNGVPGQVCRSRTGVGSGIFTDRVGGVSAADVRPPRRWGAMKEKSRYCIGREGRLQAVRAFIDNNLEWGDLSPSSAARAIGISLRQLHLLFEPTGTSFSRYVMSRRLDRARCALADPDRSVLEIAMSCGIESSTVFYRAFRQAYEITPSEYRRLLWQAPKGNGLTLKSASAASSSQLAH